MLFQQVCVTKPMKSEAHELRKRGAHVPAAPGAGGEYPVVHTVYPGFAAPCFAHCQPRSAFSPLVTFIALIVALRVTVPPSSGLFQSEPPGQEEWDLTVVVCSWNPPAGV